MIKNTSAHYVKSGTSLLICKHLNFTGSSLNTHTKYCFNHPKNPKVHADRELKDKFGIFDICVSHQFSISSSNFCYQIWSFCKRMENHHFPAVHSNPVSCGCDAVSDGWMSGPWKSVPHALTRKTFTFTHRHIQRWRNSIASVNQLFQQQQHGLKSCWSFWLS